MLRKPAFLLWSVLVGCGRELSLPEPPVAENAPRVTSVTPARAHSGVPVTIEGTGFGADPAAVQVRLGASRAVAPLSLDAAGTRLVVEVPDDASSGRVTVTTARGAGTSPTDFEHAGVGRLRSGTVRAFTSLQPAVKAVVPVATGSHLFWAAQWDVLALRDGTSLPLPLPFGRVGALASAGEPWRAVVVSGAGAAETCGVDASDCAAELLVHVLDRPRLFDAADLGLVPPPVVRLAGATDVRDLVSAALSADGAFVVVSTPRRVWLVDVAAGTSRLVASGPLPGDFGLVAPFDDGSFLVADGTALRRLDVATGTLGPPEELILEPYGSWIDALAVRPGVVGAISVGPEIYLFDASSWPPTAVAAPLEPAVTVESMSDLGLDPAGKRLFAATRNAVFSWAVDGLQATPLLITPALDASRIQEGRGGTMLVGMQGGGLVLSALGGGLVGELVLPANPERPQLRRDSCAASADSVLEVPLLGIARVARLRPKGLGDVDCARLLFPETDLAFDLAAAPSGELAVRLRSRISRFAKDATTLLEPGFPYVDEQAILHRVEDLHYSPGGEALVLRRFVSASLAEAWLVDAGLPWNDETTPVRLTLDGPLVRVLTAPGDALVLVSRAEVKVLSLSEALAGREVALRPGIVWPDGVTIDAAVGDGRLVVARTTGTRVNLHVLPLTAAERTSLGDEVVGPPFAATEAGPAPRELRLSPNGRQLQWLADLGGDRTLFATTPLDPLTGRVNGLQIQLVLPGEVRSFISSPGGETVWAASTSQGIVFEIE